MARLMILSFRLLEINPCLSLGSFLHKVVSCLSLAGLVVSKAASPLSLGLVSSSTARAGSTGEPYRGSTWPPGANPLVTPVRDCERSRAREIPGGSSETGSHTAPWEFWGLSF